MMRILVGVLICVLVAIMFGGAGGVVERRQSDSVRGYPLSTIPMERRNAEALSDDAWRAYQCDDWRGWPVHWRPSYC